MEHLLEHLHPLLFRRSVTLGFSDTLHHLQQHSILVRLLLAMLFYHWSWGPNPGCLFMGPWVQIPGCFSFFTSTWHVFHPPHPMTSMPTSPSESRLSIHPWNPLNSDVTSFRNAQASRENRHHHLQEHIPAPRRHLPRTTGMATALSLYWSVAPPQC